MRTFSIKTFGCKVNQYESQAVREILIEKGYGEVNNGGIPEIFVVNTCCVTDRAEKKSRQYIHHLQREYPDSLLVVTGCSVDYNPDSFRDIDCLVPNRRKFSICDILDNIPSGDIECTGISDFTGRTRAFVKVQDGCNQFCSYCVLPYIRGRSRSRNLEDILKEVERLISNGYREVVLTGIHLGDYDELVELLGRLEKYSSLLRIRLSSLEPQDVTDSLIEVISKSRKVCRHLHVPLQGGSDRILERMNRRYTYLEYKKIIDSIRTKVHDVTFTTDIMVGFPGECEDDFAATCNAVNEIGFVKVHIFPYSHRPGTVAAGFSCRVEKDVIKKRVNILKDIAGKKAYEMKNRLIGSFQEVLVESSGGMSDDEEWGSSDFSGYTSGYIPVRIDGVANHNELVRVKITGLDGQFLLGELFNRRI